MWSDVDEENLERPRHAARTEIALDDYTQPITRYTQYITHNPVWNSVGWLIDSWHTVPHTIWTIGLVMVHAFCMMEAHLLSIVSSISTDASVTPKAHASHGFTLVQVATLCTI